MNAELRALLEIGLRVSAENEHLRDVNAELAEALERVVAWDLPAVISRDGRPSSFTLEYGSNGAREFFRSIARAALDKHQKEKA